MLSILLLLIGLCFGSFLNVLIYRLNVKDIPKFWQGRSICPECKHQLAWSDNIPLLSFLILKGRCRYCRKKISWQYPVIELLTATLFALSGLHPDIWLLESVFLVILFSDLIYGLIPDEMILAGIVLVIASVAKQSSFAPAQIASSLALLAMTGVFAALPFFILAKFKLMGEGDIGLAFLMGFLLGWPKILTALWSAFILGGLVAIVLLALKKTKLSATIPLGPFLILGTLISALWSNEILQALVSSR